MHSQTYRKCTSAYISDYAFSCAYFVQVQHRCVQLAIVSQVCTLDNFGITYLVCANGHLYLHI